MTGEIDKEEIGKEEMKQKIKEYISGGETFDLNDHIIPVISDEPFFGIFSRSIDKRRTKNIPTAGVKWDSDRMCFVLYYNPYFLGSLENNQIAAVLKHEFYHCIFSHCTTRLPCDPEEDPKTAKRWSYATDCAINSLPDIKPDIPDFALLPEKFDLPDRKSAEFYMNNLPEDAEEEECPQCGGTGEIDDPDQEDGGEDQQEAQDEESPEQGDEQGGDNEEEQQASGEGEKEQEGGSGQDSGDGHSHGDGKVPCPNCNGKGDVSGQFDSHDWSDSSDESGDASIAESEMRKICEEARDEMRKGDSWGNTPSHLQKMIEEMLSTQIDWKKQLNRFLEKTIPTTYRTSIRKISRYYPNVHPGRKRNKESKLAVCIDQSGSVSDAMIAHFFSELNELAKHTTFVIIPFDAEVNEKEVFKWNYGEKVKAERVSCGGTDFQPPTDYINNDGTFDGAIIMTDMEAPKPGPCSCQRAWIKPESRDPHFNTKELVMEIDTTAI